VAAFVLTVLRGKVAEFLIQLGNFGGKVAES
jgi:hypothetical protein